METAETFGPGSLFGVPLTTFPPGIKWRNTREMVEEVFSDMRAGWAQDYLLRVAPLADAEVLSDPGRRARAIPLTFQATSNEALSGGFAGTTVYLRLNVPVMEVGGIGAGVAVETSFGTGGAGVVFPLDSLFVRYIVNKATGAQLNLSFNQRTGAIEATHLRHHPDGLWTSTLLWVSPEVFLSAFDEMYNVDLDKVQSSLVRSIVSVVQHPTTPLLTDGPYPYSVADNKGEHFFKSVFCSYANGAPMMSLAVFADGLWKFDMPPDSVTRLTHWGIADRLHRVKLAPHAPLPLEYTAGAVEHAQITDANVVVQEIEAATGIAGDDALPTALVFDHVIEQTHCQVTPAQKPIDHFADEDEFIRIAPKPQQTRALTEQERREEENRRKVEERKIKKRLAAAKNNERKRAERERARFRVG